MEAISIGPTFVVSDISNVFPIDMPCMTSGRDRFLY